MFSGGIQRTPYDLRFKLGDIQVAVNPMFWLTSLLLSQYWLQVGLLHLAVAILCVFVSILVHEMGHVLAGRCFGSYGEIYLWAFGGLAIGSRNCEKRWQRIVVSLAGPFAQFLLLGVIVLLLLVIPHGDEIFKLGPLQIPIMRNTLLAELLAVALFELILINFYWPLFNLLPIWPLDGGMVSRELFEAGSPRNGRRLSLHLSLALALLLAIHAVVGYTKPEFAIPYLPTGVWTAVLMAMFAFNNYQELQIENQRSHWGGDY